MAANMYRVGDYVYFENSSSNPYLIRRIEELNKSTLIRSFYKYFLKTHYLPDTFRHTEDARTASGNVEAKVVCFYRRRDISNTLIMLADKHAKEIEEESETTVEADLTDKQKHQLKHRELFLSRQYESLPATHIRGKCSVALLNETESVLSYLDKEDTFFYSLVYDPSVKTLLADKGEIRVGPRYQADIPEMLLEGESDDREQSKLEVKVWDPNSPLTDRQIDQFLVVARAVGTFARALDCSSSVRQPSLHMSAAAASRDITLFHAMDTLYRHSYDLSSAISVLVPLGGPVLCRDEMEEWSASEASLFEEALEKYGKDFNDIRQDFLPWKSLTSIIEYYYMWKTTDRYVQQKRLKAAEAESKLKQVYIPTYKPNPNQISTSNGKPGTVNGAVGTTFQPQNPLLGRACESCYATQSHQWYSWGPPNMQCRLCATCWLYWKKYGGLKMPTQSEEEKLSPSPTTEDPRVRSHMSRQAMQGMPVRNTGSPKSAVKTRQAFFLHTTYFTKFARQVCKNTLRLRQAARRPFVPINYAAIRAEYADRHAELSGSPLKSKSTRKPLACIIGYLEIHPAKKPNVIRSTPSLQTPTTKRMLTTPNHMALSILGKRNYSHHNGLDAYSFTAMDKRVRNLSLKEKFDVVKMITEEKKTVKDAVIKFKCGKTQIYSIMKEKDKIIEKYMSSTNVNVKKGRDGNYAEINKSVFEWFLQASAKNVPISGPILQAKAKETAKLLKVDGFSASNGWLQSFKKNHGITCSVACGESNEVDEDIVQNWFTKLKEIIKGYDPKDIANADETALFYRAMPNRTLKMKGEKCSRGRFSKERLTVLLTTFADGTFEKPWVIGKSEKPRCFKNIKINQLSVEWKWNKKAWMTGAIYEEFLNKLNNSMKTQNRSILLFVDNAICHRSLPLSNIKLIFFPPSTTSVLQPLDNGIIQNIKVNYRKLLLQKVIANIEMCKMASEISGKIDVLDAISFLKRSIKMIKEETIRKCFKNCGFLFGSSDSIQNETVIEPDNIMQIQDAINDIYSGVSENRVSAASYIDIDKEIATEMDEINLQEIVDSQSKDDDDEDEEDLPLEEPEPLSQTQVLSYVKALKEFGKVKGDQEFVDKATDLEICFNNFIKKPKQTKQLTLDVFIKK